MEILGIIPARGGSKGVPRKNIRPLNGKPLIAYTIEAAQQATLLHDFMVSTDDEDIAAVAKDYGADVPFLRPAELATDTARSIDAVIHVLQNMPKAYTHVLLLQPTCPLRGPQDIDDAIRLYQELDTDSLISVYKPESAHPYYMYMVEDHVMTPLIPDDQKPHHRQSNPPVYMLNGAIYLTDRQVILQKQSFYGDKPKAFIMPPLRSVNIDDELDFALAETILNRPPEE